MSPDSQPSVPTVSQSTTPTKKKPLLVPLITAALLTTMGMAVGIGAGYLVSLQNPQEFESQSTLRIEPRRTAVDPNATNQAPENTIQHEVVFPSELVVKTCLVRNKLYKLNVFSEMDKEQATRYLVQKLTVEKNDADAAVYHVSLRCEDSKDVRTLLFNLIGSYREFLDDSYKSTSNRQRDVLRQILERGNERYRKIQSEIQLLQNETNPTEDSQAKLELRKVEINEVKRQLERNQEQLLENEVLRDNEGFAFALLQEPSPGEKVGTSMIGYILYGIMAGTLLGLISGLSIGLLIRKFA